MTDNVVSHAHELTDFLARLKQDPMLDSITLPVGNGVELTYKRSGQPSAMSREPCGCLLTADG